MGKVSMQMALKSCPELMMNELLEVQGDTSASAKRDRRDDMAPM